MQTNQMDEYVADCNKLADVAYKLGERLAKAHARQGRLDDSPELTDLTTRACLHGAGFKSLAEWEERYDTLDTDDIRDHFQSGYWAGHSNAH